MKKWMLGSLVTVGILAAASPYLLSLPPLKTVFIFLLGKKLHTSISIDRLNLSWFGPQTAQNIRFQNADMGGTLQSVQSPLPFWSLSKMSSAFSLEEGVIQIHAPGYPPALISHVHAIVEGAKIEATATTSEEGKTGTVRVSADSQGPAMSLSGSGVNVPTVLVDRLLGAKGKLSALLGPSLDAKFTLKSENNAGTLEGDLSSSNAQASVSLAFTPTAITLKDPFVANFKLTPESSQLLFNTKIQSQTPIIVRIQPKGFSLPRSFSLSELQVAEATLDLGRFQIENSPAIGSLLTLLKRPQPPTAQWVNLWLTSVDATYKNGALHLGRLDALLAGGLHLCAWGDIQVVRDRLALTLGLPADTLAQSFGIQNLNPNYVLKIPVEGTLEKPELITSSATAKIATMAATQLIPKPGPLGTFFKVINAVTNDDSDVPPAKRPFPWER
jgi:hypothetical protein